MDNRIRIGVSACLLGQPVRFDGSHKHGRCLTGTPATRCRSCRTARRMGKLVAGGSGTPIRTVYAEYETLLLEALRMKTTLKKNMNVPLFSWVPDAMCSVRVRWPKPAPG